MNSLRHLVVAIFLTLLLSAFNVSHGQTAAASSRPPTGTNTANRDQAARPSFLTPLARQAEANPYHPITSRERFQWFVNSTIGPSHLLVGGIFSAAVGTALDRPKEYGPSWGGFGDRFGMRLTGISTGNAMEAALGSFWGEDPRYFAATDKPVHGRIVNVVKQTFEARRRDGDYAPAYGRYIAVSGNNFLSNKWRVQSEANVHDAVIRTAEGFAGRMAANAYEEFWPQVKNHILHRKR